MCTGKRLDFIRTKIKYLSFGKKYFNKQEYYILKSKLFFIRRLSVCLYIWVLVTCCHGYRFFQDRIPNGGSVPHPCRVGDTWMGVGHENEQGGGVRNSFGLDFHANGKVINELS